MQESETIMEKIKRIWKKNKNTCIYIAMMIIVLLAILVLLYDYGHKQVVPQFFFLGSFLRDNVVDYWSGVIKVATVVITFLTFVLTVKKFFFEKSVRNENQKSEVIRHYQELAQTAIQIFNDEYEDEAQCLFAVQIMQNIIALYDAGQVSMTIGEQSIPFRVISREGIIEILKRHLDHVWGTPNQTDEIRQDIMQTLTLLYGNVHGLWNWYDLKKYDACHFKDVYINMDYLKDLSLQDMMFTNVIFDAKDKYIDIYFAGHNEFEECIFYCDYQVYLAAYSYSAIIFRKCKLQGFKLHESIRDHRETREMRRCIKFEDTTCEGYVDLMYSIINTIEMKSCKFRGEVNMHGMQVKTELSICETEFCGGLDMQQSDFGYRVRFCKVKVWGLFYFADTQFHNKHRLDFVETFCNEFEPPNWFAIVYEAPHDATKQYCFEELFELVPTEEDGWNQLMMKRTKFI